MHPFSLTNTQAEEVTGGTLGNLIIGDPITLPPTTIGKEDGDIGEPVTQMVPEDGFSPVFPPILGPIKPVS